MTNLTLGAYGFKEIDNYISSSSVSSFTIDVNTSSEDSRVALVIGTTSMANDTKLRCSIKSPSTEDLRYTVTSTGSSGAFRGANTTSCYLNSNDAQNDNYCSSTGRRLNFTMHIQFATQFAPYAGTTLFSDCAYSYNNNPASGFLAARNNSGDEIIQLEFFALTGNIVNPAFRSYALCSDTQG